MTEQSGNPAAVRKAVHDSGSRPKPIESQPVQDEHQVDMIEEDATHGLRIGKRTSTPTELVRTVKAVCDHCGKKYRLSDRYAGRSMKCRECGEKFVVSREVSFVAKPKPPEPPRWRVQAKRFVTFLSGGKDRAPHRVKWLFNDKRAKKVRLAVVAVGVLLFASCLVLFIRSDSAKIMFSRPEGKEIAVRQIVELEETMADELAGVRTAGDIKGAARLVDGVLGDQMVLWSTLAEWKNAGFLTHGEMSTLMARYKPRLETAQKRVSQERLRIAGIDRAGNRTLIEAVKRHGSDLGRARSAALQKQGSPFAKKNDGTGNDSRGSRARELGA